MKAGSTASPAGAASPAQHTSTSPCCGQQFIASTAEATETASDAISAGRLKPAAEAIAGGGGGGAAAAAAAAAEGEGIVWAEAGAAGSVVVTTTSGGPRVLQLPASKQAGDWIERELHAPRQSKESMSSSGTTQQIETCQR